MNLNLPQVYTQAHRQYRIDMKLFYLEAPCEWGSLTWWIRLTGIEDDRGITYEIGDGFRDFLGILDEYTVLE